MNYYEHHIGDYQRKTAHLTLAEHGAYFLMLQTYYGTERNLPIDRHVLYRLLRCHSRIERAAVESVLKQFWVQTEDGFSNKRCEEVLDIYRKWCSQQKANGSRGGRPAKTHGLSGENPSHNPTETHGVTQTKPNGGYRARVPTSHLDSQIKNTTPTPSRQSRKGVDLDLDAAAADPSTKRRSPRAQGTNPRALGTNPRALGTNPRADRDERNAERDEAERIWDRLIATDGAERTVRTDDALRTIGGWQAWQMRTPAESASLRRRFLDAYRARGESVPKNGADHGLDPDDWAEREEAARAGL